MSLSIGGFDQYALRLMGSTDKTTSAPAENAKELEAGFLFTQQPIGMKNPNSLSDILDLDNTDNDEEDFTQIFADYKGISLEEAEGELLAKYGSPDDNKPNVEKPFSFLGNLVNEDFTLDDEAIDTEQNIFVPANTANKNIFEKLFKNPFEKIQQA